MNCSKSQEKIDLKAIKKKEKTIGQGSLLLYELIGISKYKIHLDSISDIINININIFVIYKCELCFNERTTAPSAE